MARGMKRVSVLLEFEGEVPDHVELPDRIGATRAAFAALQHLFASHGAATVFPGTRYKIAIGEGVGSTVTYSVPPPSARRKVEKQKATSRG